MPPAGNPPVTEIAVSDAEPTSVAGRINSFVDRHEIAWELTFAGLAIFFVALGFIEPTDPEGLQAIYAVEWAITIIFACEFGLRLWAAPIRRVYLAGHWVDLVSVVPPARWMRPFRLLRLLRLVRAFAGISRALAHLPRLAAHRGLVWLMAAWLSVTILASMGLYIAEHGINAAVSSPFDAMWWGIVTSPRSATAMSIRSPLKVGSRRVRSCSSASASTPPSRQPSRATSSPWIAATEPAWPSSSGPSASFRTGA